MTSLLAPALDRALSAHEADPTSRSGAHLAEYSFRFEPEAPVAPVPRPQSDDEWTLAQTLQELRLRGVAVERTSRRLHVRHGWRLPALAEAVRQHETAVAVWLDLGRPAPTLGWDDATALHVAWLRRTPHPTDPVDLHAGVRVTDWSRFVDSVVGRYEVGADVLGSDGLRRDVSAAFGLLARVSGTPRVLHRPARAA